MHLILSLKHVWDPQLIIENENVYILVENLLYMYSHNINAVFTSISMEPKQAKMINYKIKETVYTMQGPS